MVMNPMVESVKNQQIQVFKAVFVNFPLKILEDSTPLVLTDFGC